MDIRSNKSGPVWTLEVDRPVSTGPQPYRSVSLPPLIPNPKRPSLSPLVGNPLRHRPLSLSAGDRSFHEASRSTLGSSSSGGDDPALGGVEFWHGAERAGWLTKQGEYIKTWRRRWFVLKQGRLFWFKDPAITRASVPRGVIPVSSCLTVGCSLHACATNSFGKEQAGASGWMAAESCLERAEGDASKDSVKKDKKKKKERKRKGEGEAGTEGPEQTLDSTVGNVVAERDEAEGKESGKSKKSKRKRSDAGEASAGDQVVTREDKKRKKEHPVVLEESSQKQTLDTTVENLVAEKERRSKSKKSKHKRNDAGEASSGDQVVTREDEKRKKEHPVVLGESSQKQTLDTSVENLVVERDEVEGKQSSKSKKSKHKRDNAGEASATDQVVTREDKKRKKKHSVVLEKSSQPKNTSSKGENGEVKERGKEGNKSDPGSSDNAFGGGEEADVDDKNDKKEKKTKEGKREGVKEKEKAARSKNKGKRVSFADSTEVFETEGCDDEGTEGGKKKKKAAQSKNKGKRVSFADSAEGDDSDKSKFVHGQRFTPEEDATLMEAIRDFIEMKQLGEKGFEMIRCAREHKELRHCWHVIGKSLPHRPYDAIYHRARVLLHRSEHKWTQEEKEYIRRFVEQNGTQWSILAGELGRWSIHVKDTWRGMKSENLKKGHWTQDEYQKLFDLVNLDLRMKSHQNKNPDNRKLRDNISWEVISDKLTTRNHKDCCMKWYDMLASPMVRKGIWADVDDYLLVEALQKDDAVCVEDVDWDSLLDHRSGEVCRQRWNQMVRGIGGHREKPFIEQVDVLSRRYCPEMIEYRKK